MNNPVKFRSLRLWLLLGGVLFLLLCLGSAIFLLQNYPILGSTAASSRPIVWRSLPTPVVTRPGWASFTNAQKINDLAWRDGLVWAASDGGLLVWQASSGSVVKFTAEHGLAENQTTSIAIGLDGSVWIGTAAAGISRFDGTDWHTFTAADGLPDNRVRDLTVAVDGTVWAATAGGIGRYDGRRWYRYTRSRTLLQLPSGNVTSLATASDGATVYAGTDEGVVQFNGRSWESLAQTGSQAINTIQDLAVTPNGWLWAATPAGLIRYDGSRWTIFTTVDGLPGNDVRHLSANADGTVWLGFGEQGLGLVRFEAGQSVPVVTRLSGSDGLPDEQIFAILSTTSGTWLGSSAGLHLQLPAGGWQTFASPSEIPNNDLVNLVTTNREAWLGSRTGVSRFNGTEWESVSDGLVETAVTSLNRDSGGQLWVTFGRVGTGAARFDAASNAWRPVACPVSGPDNPYVRHLVQTAEEQFWLATEGGLATFDGPAGQWSLLDTTDGLPGDRVQGLALGSNGELWVGTDQGLAVGQDDRWRIINRDDVREVAIGPEGTVWFITADTVNRLRDDQAQVLALPSVSQVFDVLATDEGFWLAAAEGVAFYAGDQAGDGRWQRFDHLDGLPGDRVTALDVAADGTIWASSELLPANPPLSSGLYGTYSIRHNYLSAFDGRSWQPTIRPAPTGLIHPVITDIITTPDGAAWLASLGGISRFDGQHWQHFTILDGLPGHEVYELLAIDDVVWAITSGGLAQFNPASLTWKSFANVGSWTNFEAVRLGTDSSGTLWVGSGLEFWRFSGQNWQAVPVEVPDPGVQIRDFVVTPNGRLWLSAHLDTPEADQHLLAEFDGQTWRWHEVTLRAGGQFAPFTQLWLGPDGRLWASNETNLWIFDVPAGNVSRPSQYVELIRALTDLAFLPDGSIVATTRFSATPRLLLPNGSTPLDMPLSATDGFAAATGTNGSLWLGTNQGAAWRQPDGRWTLFPLSESAINQTVTELAVAADGSLLLGTTAGRVLRFAQGRVVALGNEPRGSQRSPVSALLEDANGQLWRGNFGGSVARLEEGRWDLFPASPPFYSAGIEEAAVATEGTVWLTTGENLVSVTTVGERTVCQRLAADYPGAAGLSADLEGLLWLVSERIVYRGNAAGFERVGTLALPITAGAPDGSVWYVTQTELVRVRGNLRQPVAHNLLPETITTLAIAPDGAAWLGTTEGAAVFAGGRWQKITAADGLAGNHITHIAFESIGTVWLATTGGISRFRP